MVSIPYLPTPYPDEILGSWLARIRLHNGEGAWSSLIVAAGMQRWIRAPLFDLFAVNEKLDLLFKFLGKSRESIWMELTTLPYWLAFDGSLDSQNSDYSDQSGNSKIVGVSGAITNYYRLNHTGNSYKTIAMPQFCPQCLIDDLKVWGEPFWHRAHQLPNVTACYIHGCRLQDRCVYCGLVVAPIQRSLIKPVKLQCECGKLLTVLDEGAPNISESQIALAKMSYDALTVSERNWSEKDVRKFLLKCVGTKSWVSVVHDAFEVYDKVNQHTRTKEGVRNFV